MKFKGENPLKFSIILLLVAISSSSSAQESENIETDSFPDIIRHLEQENNQIRFIYRIRWLNEENGSTAKTKLVDEAYSPETNSGRMVVRDGKSSSRKIFYWFPKDSEQSTSCSNVRGKPTNEDLLFPENYLKDMLSFEGEKDEQTSFELFGLSALLANSMDKQTDNLRLREPTSNSENSKFSLWTLNNPDSDYLLHFRFEKRDPNEKTSFANMMGLSLNVTRKVLASQRFEQGATVAELNVRKAEYKFDNNVVTLPNDFACVRGRIQQIEKSDQERDRMRSFLCRNCDQMPSNTQSEPKRQNNAPRTRRSTSGSTFPYMVDATTNIEILTKVNLERGNEACRGSGSCVGPKSSGGNSSCGGTGSCSGAYSGSGEQSCSGSGSCSGTLSGSGKDSCRGPGSCPSSRSGRGRNSCSGTGSCSGENSGGCANSCYESGSCSAANSC